MSTILQMPRKHLDLNTLNNSLLGSLVAITAGCGYVDAVGAFFIGLIGGVIALYGKHIPEFFRIDDPLDTFTVHGLNGAWGLIATGLFATREFTNPDFDYGCFYGGTGHLLGYQIAATCAITLVAFGVAFCTFGLMYVVGKYVLQMPGENPLRISIEDEVIGLDIKEFGGYAYPEQDHQVALIMKKAEEFGIDLTASAKKSEKKEKKDVPAPTQAVTAAVPVTEVPSGTV